ncbi:putative late blight resistance protein homolog R1A-3 [Salvia splendens]|uniref:putative late blight resistance protein homolog R1A-3 n=1 Tax=Salvia splendens TaxID=180675 RepID=UPI001C268CEB|nr:putative late blight resistance protein homolog R1A-3 [Salvia splendens]
MAAYAALASLMHIIDTLKKHPSPPISIDQKQVESLTQNVALMQEFLDGYMSPVVADGHEADPLERRIADAVYAAEDLIESKIVAQTHPPRTLYIVLQIRRMRMSLINLFRAAYTYATTTATATAAAIAIAIANAVTYAITAGIVFTVTATSAIATIICTFAFAILSLNPIAIVLAIVLAILIAASSIAICIAIAAAVAVMAIVTAITAVAATVTAAAASIAVAIAFAFAIAIAIAKVVEIAIATITATPRVIETAIIATATKTSRVIGNAIIATTTATATAQEFLYGYISPVSDSHEGADPSERLTADVAAEDDIESQIVVQPTIIEDRDFHQNLQKVIEEMNQIVEMMAVEGQLQQKPVAALPSSSTVKENIMVPVDTTLSLASSSALPLTSSSTVKKNGMVGFDQVFTQVLNKLTEDKHTRQIIPITGMGGIGKTTLAKNLFEHAFVKGHFEVRALTIISQTYSVSEILREVYIQASQDSDNLTGLGDNELGDRLYKFLYDKRYLIILDDMWSIDVWNKIKVFFLDNKNGSRIIITTRLSNLCTQLNESYKVVMKFLDEPSSWKLFLNTVFGEENCPVEFENIGKIIVANCKGLPLSIVTIGGLLANSERKIEYWEDIERNLNSIVFTNNDELCLKTLRMSYIYLPNYLKPCFLYMGMFWEDRSIRVSVLKRVWVSEGFLKPRSGKCLEIIAQENFKELVDRNLILIDKLGSTGNVKFCKIHDLLRDLCLKEVEKERFYHVVGDDPPAINSERRVVFSKRRSGVSIGKVLGSLSHARSLIEWNGDGQFWLPHNLRLLRTLHTSCVSAFLDNVFELVNARHLVVRVNNNSKFPSSISLPWNLHTLIIRCWGTLTAPIEIWELHQLRHLEFAHREMLLPDPPSGGKDVVIMENLHTLKGVVNLFLNEEVVRRIPNVKKLHVSYEGKQMEEKNSLKYLQCLDKLENFRCTTRCYEYLQRIRFPNSLKKLSVITSDGLVLEDIMPKIGSLPLLEKFSLFGGHFRTGMLITTESQFPSLKFLELEECKSLKHWIISDNSSFPLLQKLSLVKLDKLKVIPSEVGEIATLKLIDVEYCTESLVKSAKKIVEDQKEELGGDQLDFHVRAIVQKEHKALKNLKSANFEVEVGYLFGEMPDAPELMPYNLQNVYVPRNHWT